VRVKLDACHTLETDSDQCPQIFPVYTEQIYQNKAHLALHRHIECALTHYFNSTGMSASLAPTLLARVQAASQSVLAAGSPAACSTLLAACAGVQQCGEMDRRTWRGKVSENALGHRYSVQQQGLGIHWACSASQQQTHECAQQTPDLSGSSACACCVVLRSRNMCCCGSTQNPWNRQITVEVLKTRRRKWSC
jgi:hypothetical protein